MHTSKNYKKKVISLDRKSMLIRPSGRSSDFISPSFGYGCLLNCAYCYMKRHKPDGLDYAENIGSILTEISNHAWFENVEKPNQTDPKYITYDISCNEDFALHSKYHDWQRIFQFFMDHPVAKATFATKVIPIEFLNLNPNKKVRIRFSLMPQWLSSILEPKTPQIIDRIKAIDAFVEAGYEVHINYSPVIITDTWEKDYEELFEMVDTYIDQGNKHEVLSEVIFLTHNKDKHNYNLANFIPGENLLWNPSIQESKISQYGGENLRYKSSLKKDYIKKFQEIHNRMIPWNKIRYIF